MAKYNATFVSVWDGGIRVKSRCRVNNKTRMITKMGKNDIGDNEEMLDILEREYVVVDGDDTEYTTHNVDGHANLKPNEFYYE